MKRASATVIVGFLLVAACGGRTIDDYGQTKAGAATTAEVKFDVKQDGKSYGQCLLFAWVEATPRKNTQAFACDDIGAVEKWKSDQSLKSDWR